MKLIVCDQIVCNASEAHNRNVKQIETLINTCAEQGKTIESLLGNDPSFSTDASRMAGGGGGGAKRARVDDPPQQHTNSGMIDSGNKSAQQSALSATAGGGDAWDLFSNMMREDTKALYY